MTKIKIHGKPLEISSHYPKENLFEKDVFEKIKDTYNILQIKIMPLFDYLPKFI